MPNTEQPITPNKIITGVAITIIAALVLWLCSSTVSHGNRLAVLESQYSTISMSLDELKCDSKKNRDLLYEIKNMCQRDTHGSADKTD